MSEVEGVEAKVRAIVAADALARHYDALANVYRLGAQRLRETPVESLAKHPVPYLHHSTRALEEKLDEALMAL